MAAKYPNTIHVTRENWGTDEEFLAVHEDGALDTDFDESRDCAVYQLVTVGRVEVNRRFIEGKRRVS